MAIRQIPLTADPNQVFAVSLPVDGKNLDLILELRYNTEAGYWTMDVLDKTRNPLLAAIPLFTGTAPAADLLGQYGYLGIGRAVIVPSGHTTTGQPNDQNLGAEFFLLWGDTSE